MADDEILIDTGKGRKMTLEELGVFLPGMAEIMPRVGERIWKLYYAARAENWPLARFQLKEAVNLMEKGAFIRPKYEDNMAKFVDENCAEVSKAIEAKDLAAFETAFATMVEQANAYHELYDKPFLRWKVPGEPPPDLDMTPRR
jgi:hypothetical protein